MTRAARVLAGVLVAGAAGLGGARPASAFCGFYVSGATGELYNNATQVVLMREGTRTVLSMANNYQGPPQDFAMVVPVPVILQKENVKTLPAGLFKKVDQLAAPRLVEYWEQDPCKPALDHAVARSGAAMPRAMAAAKGGGSGDLGVTVEAQFEVGEYQVVILSARDSSGLDTWLRQEKYSIPAGAEAVLKPYVASGMKFFVARVDIAKVKKEGEKTMLSPLRFHYDSERFELPVRLGLLNSSGKQDLLVHILSRGKRYEVANYPNATIPTNLDVGEITRDQFAAFYAALLDQTMEKNPKAVVTEYAWDASTCDPCPGPTLDFNDLATLGADAIPPPGGAAPAGGAKPGPGLPPGGLGAVGRSRLGWRPSGFVLTRLHARYGKDTLGEDLVFKEASAITGGREVRADGKKLEQGATRDAGVNNFQGRYAIRHPWKGPVTCDKPQFGRWGGPPEGARAATRAATDPAFAPRGGTALASFLAQDVPEIGAQGKAAPVSPVPGASGSATAVLAPAPATSGAAGVSGSSGETTGAPPRTGCGGCTAAGVPAANAGALAGLVAALGARWRRRRPGRGSSAAGGRGQGLQ